MVKVFEIHNKSKVSIIVGVLPLCNLLPFCLTKYQQFKTSFAVLQFPGGEKGEWTARNRRKLNRSTYDGRGINHQKGGMEEGKRAKMGRRGKKAREDQRNLRIEGWLAGEGLHENNSIKTAQSNLGTGPHRRGGEFFTRKNLV